MLKCWNCKNMPKEKVVHENGVYEFDCDCGSRWVEMDFNKEIFNETIDGKNVKSLSDLLNLREEGNVLLNDIIEDVVSRINDWLVGNTNYDKDDEDVYVRRNLDYLKTRIKHISKAS